MKKTLLTLLIALVAITSVFAVDPTVSYTGAPAGQAASTKVSFDLTPSDITYFKFGFTQDIGKLIRLGVNTEPTPLESIELSLSEDKSSASSTEDMYIYYYFQGEKLPTITLAAGKGLSRDGYDGTIDYDVKVTGTSVVASSGKPGQPITLKPLKGGVSAAYYGFTIETTTPITANMASNTNKTWSDTITLTITG